MFSNSGWFGRTLRSENCVRQPRYDFHKVQSICLLRWWHGYQWKNIKWWQICISAVNVRLLDAERYTGERCRFRLNYELAGLYDEPSIRKVAITGRIRWTEHVVRLPGNNLVKILFAADPEQEGVQRCWQDVPIRCIRIYQEIREWLLVHTLHDQSNQRYATYD